MAKIENEQLLAALERGDLPPEVTLRNKPTTSWQKADVWFEDMKTFFSKHKWVIITFVIIPLVITFVYFLSSTASLKVAVRSMFIAIGSLIGIIFTWFLSKIFVTVIIFAIVYPLAKKLLVRDMISFCEIGGAKEEILTIRETADEVVMYKDRSNWLATIIFGKKKVHTSHQLYNLLKEIGEERVFRLYGEEYNFLRVYILPQTEVKEELFIKDEEGKLTLNTNYLIDKEDVEEFIIRHQHPDVPKNKLLTTFFNLEAKVRHYRRTIAVLENEAEQELEEKFLDYVIHNTPYSYAKDILRKKIKKELEKEHNKELPEELREIIESYQNELGENEEG